MILILNTPQRSICRCCLHSWLYESEIQEREECWGCKIMDIQMYWKPQWDHRKITTKEDQGRTLGNPVSETGVLRNQQGDLRRCSREVEETREVAVLGSQVSLTMARVVWAFQLFLQERRACWSSRTDCRLWVSFQRPGGWSLGARENYLEHFVESRSLLRSILTGAIWKNRIYPEPRHWGKGKQNAPRGIFQHFPMQGSLPCPDFAGVPRRTFPTPALRTTPRRASRSSSCNSGREPQWESLKTKNKKTAVQMWLFVPIYTIRAWLPSLQFRLRVPGSWQSLCFLALQSETRPVLRLPGLTPSYKQLRDGRWAHWFQFCFLFPTENDQMRPSETLAELRASPLYVWYFDKIYL